VRPCTTRATRRRLIGKAHFEPLHDPFGLYAENALAIAGIPTIEQDWFDGRRGVHRVSTIWSSRRTRDGCAALRKVIRDEHPDAMRGFYQCRCRLQREAAGGVTRTPPQVK